MSVNPPTEPLSGLTWICYSAEGTETLGKSNLTAPEVYGPSAIREEAVGEVFRQRRFRRAHGHRGKSSIGRGQLPATSAGIGASTNKAVIVSTVSTVSG